MDELTRIDKEIEELEEEFRQCEEHLTEDQCEDINCADALVAISRGLTSLRARRNEILKDLPRSQGDDVHFTELEEQIKAYRLILDDGVNAEKEIYFVPGYGWEADLGGTNMGYCDTLPDALARLSGK